MRGLIDRALAYIADHAWKGYGTEVDIGTHTSYANAYTAPCEGIVRVRCGPQKGAYCYAYVDNQYMAMTTSNNSYANTGYICASVHVYKGQKIHVSFAVNAQAYFIPLINAGGGYCLTLLRAISVRRWRYE